MSKEPATKRIKTDRTYPTSFVTWNCNGKCWGYIAYFVTLLATESAISYVVYCGLCEGFTSRTQWDRNHLERLLRETDYPDVICMQEVRLKATSPSLRGKPLDSEYLGSVKEVLETLFQDYNKYWSLADTRYSGTLTLLHKRLQFVGSEDTVAFTPESAIRLLLKQHNLTRKEVGLDVGADRASKEISNNQQDESSPKKNKRQTSVTSFFSVKKSPTKTEASSSKSNSCQFLEHNEEGRFQFFFFPNMDVMQTYVPNNGMKEDSFKKRRQWDKQMKDFFVARGKILKSAAERNGAPLSSGKEYKRPILWCGDLNVARDYRDGTHWKQKEDGTIEEWWTDESKCLVASDKKASATNQAKSWEDTGIPSFTPSERRRCEDLIQTADLVDIWRELHPNGVNVQPGMPSSGDCSTFCTDWEMPNFTWRGHLAKSGAYQAKYQGKGQRLDYFLLSPSSFVRKESVVESCEILGYGEQRLGLFCGSDHCASLLRLKRKL